MILSLNATYKRPESVLVVVHTKDAEILLLLRRDDPHFWQSVTGSMRENELSPLETALRELEEETGLTANDGMMRDCHYQEWFDIYPKWRHRYAPSTTRNLEHVFCFEVAKPRSVVLSLEHLNYEWVPKLLAVKKVISETNRNAILKFVKSVGEKNGRA